MEQESIEFANPDLSYRRRTRTGLSEDRAWDEGLDDLQRWLTDATSPPAVLDPIAMADLDPHDQQALIQAATSADIELLAHCEGLFSLDTAVIGACLLRATRTTLLNRSCPPSLRERVRYPYDVATLELALRAGSGCFERPRVRRMLAELSDDHFTHLLASAPLQLVERLREFELISVDDLVEGRLRSLDLSDPDVVRALFGHVLISTHHRVFTDVLLRHPQSADLIWFLDDSPRGILLPEEARQLIDTGAPEVARAVMRHLPLDWLRPSDEQCARRCGDVWLASCPGLPAVERPSLPMDLGCPSDAYSSATRIWYPSLVQQLDGASFDEAPNWKVTLPVTIADVQRNARLMRNCTAHLVDQVMEGSVFLVVVHDPQGRRYNVTIVMEDGRFEVSQVNSWANGGVEPSWVRKAFRSRLNQTEERVPWDDEGPTQRPQTTHRDRRRASARAHRLLKR